MLTNGKSNSFQAVSLIANSSNGITTRIFYAISFIFTTFAFFFYVYQAYEKWKVVPDIAMRRNQKYLAEIPFPALTICSPVFARSDTMAYRNYSSVHLKEHPEILGNVSSSVANYLIANQHACNPYFTQVSEKVDRFRTERNVVKLLDESFLQIDDVLADCIYGSRFTSCPKMFNRVLTDRGFCYSFNMQGFDTVFNAGVISDDFHSYKRRNVLKSPKFRLRHEGFVRDDNETAEWTLDRGYSSTHKRDFVPVAAQKGGTMAFFLYLTKANYENMCGVFTNVFSYSFHLPNEIPTHFHHQQFIRFHDRSHVSLTATAYKTNDELRKLTPDARGCYFEGERQLKFFKSYTKNHCDLECVTNFTLKHCGCVKFSMPRDDNTTVCDYDKAKCYYSAMSVWPGYNETTRQVISSCNCLRTCNDIQYSIAIEEASRTTLGDNPLLLDRGITEEDMFAYLKFMFVDNFIVEEESYAPYVLQNFIADTGGLLGLFIGCSILSIFELCYYVTIKTRHLFAKVKQPKGSQDDAQGFRVNVIDVKPFQKDRYCTSEDLLKHRHELEGQFSQLRELLKQRDRELASVLDQISSQRL